MLLLLRRSFEREDGCRCRVVVGRSLILCLLAFFFSGLGMGDERRIEAAARRPLLLAVILSPQSSSIALFSSP